MKPIIVDMYTDRSYVYEFAKPAPSSEFYPDWWFALHPTIKDGSIDQPTMVSCEGFLAQYRRGLIIPMWSDLMLEVAAEGSVGCRWAYADNKSAAQVHMPAQRGSYLPDGKYQHLKLDVPWVFRCDEDVSFQLLQPMWNFDDPDSLLIPPGVLNFKYQFAANINMFIRRTPKAQEILIPHGQPMVQLIPLTERPVLFRPHLVTAEEMSKQSALKTTIKFAGTYRRIKSLMTKCPFGG